MEQASTDGFVEILASAETMGGDQAGALNGPLNDPLDGPPNGPPNRPSKDPSNGPTCSGKKTKMSDAQKDHIRRVRSLVESGSDAFYEDWRRILIKPRLYGGKAKISVEAFCIKPSAAFVPHLLISGFHPYCPKCKRAVPTIKFRWVVTPMIMFGIDEHRYLDTVRYTCELCGCSFRGTDLQSMALDKTGQCRATFGIYLLPRCAVDEELYNFVVAATRVPVQAIETTLKKLAYQKYVSRVQQYYQMILQAHGSVSAHKPLQAFLLPRGDQGSTSGNSTGHSDLRQLKLKLNRAKSECETKKRKASQPLDLCKVKGLGTAKKRKFNALGIVTCQQLLEALQNHEEYPDQYSEMCKIYNYREADSILAGYGEKISELIEKGNKIVTEAEAKVASLRDQVSALDSKLRHDAPATTVEPGATQQSGTTTTCDIVEFPKFDDRGGYNGRFFSSHCIESIQVTHFSRRKPGMTHRLTNTAGRVLSMDTVYGPASQVVVYVNRKPFRPFKGLTTMMNEHGEVLWFGFIKGGESIAEIEPSLRKLKARLDRIQGPDGIQVIYVDNCCKVRKKLQEIFGPNVFVKLDVFHWQQRWNEVIREKNSQRHRVFRALMSRAVLQASEEEFKEKRAQLLEKLRRTPSVKEVLAKCNTKTPPAAEIRQSVCAIVEYFLLEDARTVVRNAGSEEVAKTPLFFKDPKRVRDKLSNQLSHIECLEDPPGVCLHHQTPDDKTRCARGSGKNEIFNRKANKAFSNVVGIARAERDIWSLADDHNQQMNVKRRGAHNYYVTNLEGLAYCNALAEKAGCELPFEISLPTVEVTTEETEQFGFDICNIDAKDEAEDEDERIMEDAIDDDADDMDLDAVNNDVDRIQGLIYAACDATTARPRSSLQAFTTITGQNAWLPFSGEDDPTSKEELRLFDKMCTTYNRHAKSGSPTSYAAFSRAWDLEAGRRYLARLGGEDITPVYCKTAQQLSTHFDKLEQENAASTLATIDGMQRLRQVNQMLKHARSEISRPQVSKTQPIRFPQAPPGSNRYTPLCDPVTMNAVAAFPNGLPMNQDCTHDGANPFSVEDPKKQELSGIRTHSATLFRKVCRKCGRAKGEHQRSPTGSLWGSKRCGFRHCGRCALPESYHVNGKMGVFCSVDTKAFPFVQANMLSQFDERISTLNSS